ncbi:MAG: hypothetical protein R8L58_02235, partial [Mariprofundaceae bacterium]
MAMAEVGLLRSMEEQMDAAKQDMDILRIRDEIERLFNGFSGIPELLEMRVLRGKSVQRQFGAGSIENRPNEEVEKEMLNSGKVSETLQTNPDGTRVFHFNGPLIASSHGRINCMQCHDASEGEVLGGLSVQIDVSKADAAVTRAIYGVIALLVLAGLIFAIGLQRILMPMVKMVSRITSVFDQAVHGDFSQRLVYAGHDEIGEIAQSTNHLMESLDTHIGAIA